MFQFDGYSLQGIQVLQEIRKVTSLLYIVMMSANALNQIAGLDIINMINSADRYFFSDQFLQETFYILGNTIKSCHLKDIRLLDDYTFQLKECACGEGTFNFVKYMDLATKLDPDMPMIIEHLKSDDAYEESVGYVLSAYNNRASK